ncbi:MAG: adenosylcobinamide-phosphate synthase CbiB [Acidimicrobiales bacterium]
MIPARFANRAAGAGIGLALDAILGEAPTAVHPVAGFGRAMGKVESVLYRDSRGAGVAHLGSGLALAGITGAALEGLGAAARSGLARSGLARSGLACYVAVAGASLAKEAGRVGAALDAGDLDRARKLLPTLVGRNADELDEKEISRAVVESVAENTVDGIVAPMMWTALAGPVGALGYRAVNTMDSMVGHRSDRYRLYGWASARTDDGANWLPARLTAALVILVRPRSARAVWEVVRSQAPGHPSPNAGVVEAAFAAALGLRLGGQNSYGDRVEIRPCLGRGDAPQAGDIARAVALARHVWITLGALLALPAVVRGWRRR